MALRVVPKVYFDHLTGTEGIWEIRTQAGSNIFRVFCCFDEGNLVILLSAFHKKTQETPQKEIDQGQLVVLFNGSQKKTQKTPKEEIDRAMRLKDEYFNLKRQNNEKV